MNIYQRFSSLSDFETEKNLFNTREIYDTYSLATKLPRFRCMRSQFTEKLQAGAISFKLENNLQ